MMFIEEKIYKWIKSINAISTHEDDAEELDYIYNIFDSDESIDWRKEYSEFEDYGYHFTRLMSIDLVERNGILAAGNDLFHFKKCIKPILLDCGFDKKSIDEIKKHYEKEPLCSKKGKVHFYLEKNVVNDCIAREYSANIGGEYLRHIIDTSKEQMPYKNLYIKGKPYLITIRYKLGQLTDVSLRDYLKRLIAEVYFERILGRPFKGEKLFALSVEGNIPIDDIIKIEILDNQLNSDL